MIDRESSLQDEIFSRIKGIFETEILKDKVVTIIGLGTGGSLAAVELAKCGVRRFLLVDFDTLEVHNVIRHACGIRDLGRFKTEAVRDAILNINPEADIECSNVDILEKQSLMERLIRSADIVLVCTDSERSKYRINAFCIKLWREEGIVVPAVYAGAYERAFGGDVMRVIPGETPCYDCVVGTVQQMSIFESKPKAPVVYSDVESAEDFIAEPGLSLDVHFIVLIQAKLALLTLLRGTDSKLEDISYNFLFWGNHREWIFKEPFKCIFANVQKRDNCPTCSVWDYKEKELDMTREQIENEAKELLNGLPKIDLPIP